MIRVDISSVFRLALLFVYFLCNTVQASLWAAPIKQQSVSPSIVPNLDPVVSNQVRGKNIALPDLAVRKRWQRYTNTSRDMRIRLAAVEQIRIRKSHFLADRNPQLGKNTLAFGASRSFISQFGGETRRQARFLERRQGQTGV